TRSYGDWSSDVCSSDLSRLPPHWRNDGDTSMFRSTRSSFAALIILFSPSLLLAQSGSGVISGIVRDSSGGVLPGATVKITNEERSEERRVGKEKRSQAA